VRNATGAESNILSRSRHNDDSEDIKHGDNNSLSEDEDEEFVYPAALPVADVDTVHILSPPTPRQVHASPAQLESLYAAASSGDLPLLKKLFENALESAEVEPFNLANDASSRTGFTALHAAASRGYHDIAVWCM
jgi:ankyrin repeat protein